MHCPNVNSLPGEWRREKITKGGWNEFLGIVIGVTSSPSSYSTSPRLLWNVALGTLYKFAAIKLGRAKNPN